MLGPFPQGYCTARDRFGELIPGNRYRVTSAFTDFDGHCHAKGETWIYIGSSFLPYDDGLSLFISLTDGAEWQIRLQWRPETQGPIIDSFHDFVELVEAA